MSVTEGISGTRARKGMPSAFSRSQIFEDRAVVRAGPRFVGGRIGELDVHQHQVHGLYNALEHRRIGVAEVSMAACKSAIRPRVSPQSPAASAPRRRKKVTPPPLIFSARAFFATRRAASALVISRPAIRSAPRGQAATQAPQAAQPSGCGQTASQAPQWMHRSRLFSRWGFGEKLSGLWHHLQRSGQPLRKITLRMPGPS